MRAQVDLTAALNIAPETEPASPSDELRGRGGDVRAYRVVASGPPAAGAEVPTVVDSGGHFRHLDRAGEGTAYLVRPDGYVGFRTDSFGRGALDAYLSRVFRL